MWVASQEDSACSPYLPAMQEQKCKKFMIENDSHRKNQGGRIL